MNYIKFIAGFVLAVAAMAFGYTLGQSGDRPVAGGAGADYTERQTFISQPVFGGAPCYATSTTAAVGTLPNIQDGTNCVDFTVNQADVTLTLMASTSSWLPNKINSTRTLRIRNASTTATADIILAAGTGINIKAASSTVGKFTIFGDTGADNYAEVTFTRQADTDVNAEVRVFTD